MRGYIIVPSHRLWVQEPEHALRQLPELIITDWVMPGGGELCRQIRAQRALAHIPILVHPAMPPSSPGPVQWDDCLIKPVPAVQLFATVKRCVRREARPDILTRSCLRRSCRLLATEKWILARPARLPGSIASP